MIKKRETRRDDPKTKKIEFLVTMDEFEIIKKEAEKRGVTRSLYIVNKIFELE